MQALITANMKAALEAIQGQPDYNTTIDTVEEARTVLRIEDQNYLLLQEERVRYLEDYQHTNDVIYQYTIVFFSGNNDEAPNDPYAYQNRNVVADITKALMIDRTRGGYAMNTTIDESGPDFFADSNNGMIIPVTSVAVDVHALVNADNPYQLA